MKKKKKKWMTNTCWTIRVNKNTLEDLGITVCITFATLFLVLFAIAIISFLSDFDVFDFGTSVVCR